VARAARKEHVAIEIARLANKKRPAVHFAPPAFCMRCSFNQKPAGVAPPACRARATPYAYIKSLAKKRAGVALVPILVSTDKYLLPQPTFIHRFLSAHVKISDQHGVKSGKHGFTWIDNESAVSQHGTGIRH
jgi:hypothetical protein